VTPASGPSGSIPFRVAQAYNVQAGSAAGRLSAAPAARSVAPPAQRVSVPPAVPAPAQAPAQAVDRAPAQRLVAAVVPGAVDFSADSPRPTARDSANARLPMYRHPADKNAVATSILVGRRLDISG
jgi:hypothetical protein